MSEASASSVPAPSGRARYRGWMAALPRISWGLGLILLVGAAIITSGAPVGALTLVIAAIAILTAWEFPYISFYISLATAPLLSWTVSLSTGQLAIGDRAFGGAIDVSVGEVIAACVLIAWACRLLFHWQGRRDRHWQPWLPLIIPYLALVSAHLLSAFSSAQPDALLVIKYSLRPVLTAYILYVALPVNFIRSKRRLMGAMFTLTLVGTFFAFDGLRSFLTFDPSQPLSLHAAHPSPILGVSPIGDNHNLLAELMVFTAPLATALSLLVKDKGEKKLLWFAAGLMSIVGLLTFARSAWLSAALQIVLLSSTIWREWIKANRHLLKYVLILLLPLFAFFIYSASSFEVQGSTDARATLAGIAWQLFTGNPILGVGAGTFQDHVARTFVFTIEFGSSLDSHGMLQKVGAETGIVGLVALAAVVIFLLKDMWKIYGELYGRPTERAIFTYLAVAVLGAFFYQIFNTTYWTAKLWLPVGLMYAAGRILVERVKQRDPDFLHSSYE